MSGRACAAAVAAVFLAAGARAWAGAETRTLTLSQSVEIALGRDLLVRGSKQALEGAKAALVEAETYTPRLSVGSRTSAASSGGLDPQSDISGTDYSSQSYYSSVDVPLPGGLNVDLSTSAATSTTNSAFRAGGGTAFTYAGASAGLGLSRPLPLLRDEAVLTEGPRWAAQMGVQGAELSLEEARQRVVGETLTRFFAALRTQRQAEIADASRHEADELLRIAQEKLKVGELAEIEAMEARVSAESAGVAYRRALSAAASALDDLRHFLGIPLEEELRLAHDDAGAGAPVTLNEWALVERALARRTDLRQLTLGARSAELSVRQAEAQSRPGFYLTGGYTRSGEADSISASLRDLVNPSWYVGIVATTNLTPREDRAAIDRARGALGLARAEEQVRREEVRLEIRRLLRAVQDAEANAAVLAETVKIAEENLRIRRVQFEHGLIRSVDVTQTERQLSETRNQRLDALVDSQLAAARLILAMGETPVLAGPQPVALAVRKGAS